VCGIPASQVVCHPGGPARGSEQQSTTKAACSACLPQSFHAQQTSLPVFDLILLGIGPDGHVRLLFPSTPATAATKGWVLPVSNSLKPPPGAHHLHHACHQCGQGGGRCGCWEKARQKLCNACWRCRRCPGALPAQLVRPASGKLKWVLDSLSAQELRLEDWATNSGFPRSA